MSSFVANHIQSLPSNTALNLQTTDLNESVQRSDNAEEYYALLLGLKTPLDASTVRSTVAALHNHEEKRGRAASLTENAEEYVLKQALQNKLFLGLYAEALDVCLQEAAEADSEAAWWDDIERSRRNIAWYLLQTLPGRLKRGFETVVNTLRSQNAPIRLSSFSPGSIRRMYPQTLRPSILMTSLFPHLSQQTHFLFTSPLELTRQECQSQRKNLLKLRDKHAEVLGQLLYMKGDIALHATSADYLDMSILKLQSILSGDSIQKRQLDQTTSYLYDLSSIGLSTYKLQHRDEFKSLRRPSRLTLIWPRLAFIPPAALLLFRLLYSSRMSIAETSMNIIDTIQGFWFGYVIEPIRGILNTIRTGGEESARIVNAEGVKADLDSLERMALDLSREKLSYSSAELQAISEQIHQGDLTPVMKIYEQDIKTPIKSAITGSLVRSLLIQIQKAKVDLDRALTGIDKLLKSQELTFGFVGVAPSLAIVYLVVGYLRDIWRGGRGNSRYGGKKRREATFIAMRRIERLLNHIDARRVESSEPTQNQKKSAAYALPPVVSGLLLISVSHLRTYAEIYLPERSRLREGILEDVADLEDPDLGRAEKQRVVDRMWRSWGVVLGWVDLASLPRK